MKRKTIDRLIMGVIAASALFTIAVLVFIVGFITMKGFAHVDWNFLSNTYTKGGIYPMILGTIYIVVLTLFIATPIALFAALYLNEYAKDTPFTRVIRFAIDALTSIPSIVYGLFGFSLFVSIMSLGYSILSGALTLSIMILPVIIRTVEETLKTVPKEMKEGSLALGASKTQTIFKVIIPYSLKGIVTAVILGMSRVISESAPLILTAGMVYKIPKGIMSSSRTLTTHLYFLVSEGIGQSALDQAYATAFVLIIIIIILNLGTKWIGHQLQKKVG
ncbi:MAG: phosphate ABC transporter permease PstA [Erysipelotrichaceae bacterium]